LPLNIVEAMLWKKPIVATYNRGHNELIKEGENGFLVSPNSINDMSERIYTIYNDVELAKKLALKSNEIAQNYTVNAVKNTFFSFITQN
jgi:glycosyltransferase EpsD